MLRTFIQVTALAIVLLSSFFLIRGSITLSAKDMAELSKPKWDYHTGIAANLTRQRADTIVGFTLLLLSFFLQMINMLLPMTYGGWGINKKGLLIAVIVSVLIFLIANITSDFMYRKSYKQVEDILKSNN